MNGRPSRADTRPRVQKLTALEETAIVNYILDMDIIGFSPKLLDVKDMANFLLKTRHGQLVGKLWAH